MLKWINALGLVVAAALLLALYVANTEISSAQARLAELQETLAEERGEINRLTADEAYLEDPEQLRVLARAHLGFEPVRPDQEIALAELPRVDADGLEQGEIVEQINVSSPGGGAGGRP
ncbi:MAG: hypothetical protein AAFX09_09160 [Pseudomonadota bacterium]